MELFDFIVIGSGPSGAWSSKKLSERGYKVAVVDIGDSPSKDSYPKENLYDLKEKGLKFEDFIGNDLESLDNVWGSFLSPKLKAPLMRFVTKSSYLSKVNDSFHGLSSSAKGGLANAWGGHLYRFSDSELENFPFKYKDLKPFYDEISREVGISGVNDDDLSPFLEYEEGLLPPLNLDKISNKAYSKYKKNKNFFNKESLYIGAPRIAITTKEHDSRKEYSYQNLEFFYPSRETLYSPRFTINKLITNNAITYIDSSRVTKFNEQQNCVEVIVENINSKEVTTLKCKKLFIACGVLNSTRIVAKSLDLINQKLPFLDNQVSYIPLVNPLFIGTAQERDTYNAQLNMVYKGIYGTFYNLNSIFRTDTLFEFPLNFKNLMWASRNLFQSIHILQLWYPGEEHSDNNIRLDENDRLIVNYSSKLKGSVEKDLIRLLIRLGYVSNTSLVKYLEPGSSYHYAGTMPMYNKSCAVWSDTLGLINGLKRVHVVDSSIFPYLPSKNLSYSIMANAARIAEKVEL